MDKGGGRASWRAVEWAPCLLFVWVDWMAKGEEQAIHVHVYYICNHTCHFIYHGYCSQPSVFAYVDDQKSWKRVHIVMEKSWNFFIRFLWEPCIV